MSATTPAATTTRPPVAATRIALVRLTSPISSCVEPHQEAHQKSVSAGHGVARSSTSKRRSMASRTFSPRRASLARESSTCRPADTCAGAPLETAPRDHFRDAPDRQLFR
jgi:hypothetical protein